MQVSQAFNAGRALNIGWEGFKLAPAPLFVGGFLLFITNSQGGGFNFPSGDFSELFEGGGGGGGGWGGQDSKGQLLLHALRSQAPAEQFLEGFMEGLGGPGLAGLGLGFILAAAGCLMGVALAFFLLRCWLSVGWVRLHREVVTTGSGEFSTLFSGGDRMLDMVLWRLLAGLVGAGTFVVAGAPAIALAVAAAVAETPAILALAALAALFILLPAVVYVGLGLSLGNHALVLEELKPMAALERAWSVASGERLTLFVFYLVLALVTALATGLGICLLCVGIFITGPIALAVTELGTTHAYMLFLEGEEAAADWALRP